MRGAILEGAKLRGADLTGAILVDADLSYANLRLAKLTGADLTGAILVDADLTGATMPDGTIYSGRAPNPGYGHRHGYGRKVISPDLTGASAAEAAEREYAMGDEDTEVGIVPVHIYSDGKRVYFFYDAVDANKFLETLPPSTKSRAKIGYHFSSTTVTLYPPGRAPNPGYGHHRGYGRRR